MKLFKSGSRRSFKFTPQHRQNIIRCLVNHVNLRIDMDQSLDNAIRPLLQIQSTVRQLDLETCHAFVTSDVDKLTYFVIYERAAELEFVVDCGTRGTPKTNLQTLRINARPRSCIR